MGWASETRKRETGSIEYEGGLRGVLGGLRARIGGFRESRVFT